MLEVFRALWSDPTRQTFMLTNDIQPGNCSISWNLGVGEETFWPLCQNNGAVLSATIDGITYAVSDVVMTP